MKVTIETLKELGFTEYGSGAFIYNPSSFSNIDAVIVDTFEHKLVLQTRDSTGEHATLGAVVLEMINLHKEVAAQEAREELEYKIRGAFK